MGDGGGLRGGAGGRVAQLGPGGGGRKVVRGGRSRSVLSGWGEQVR